MDQVDHIVSCSKCFQMKMEIRELKTKIESLEQNRELEKMKIYREADQKEIKRLTTELNQERQTTHKTNEKRHQEQKAIIEKLIEYLATTQERECTGHAVEREKADVMCELIERANSLQCDKQVSLTDPSCPKCERDSTMSLSERRGCSAPGPRQGGYRDAPQTVPSVPENGHALPSHTHQPVPTNSTTSHHHHHHQHPLPSNCSLL